MKPILLPGLPQPMKLIRSHRCENCKWSEREGPTSKNFMCHRNPPTVTILPTNQGPMPVCSFAVVTPTQWCGEHQPKIGAHHDAVPEPAATSAEG